MVSFFFFNDTATTEIYTLSLHDALPFSVRQTPPPETPAHTRHPWAPQSGETTSAVVRLAVLLVAPENARTPGSVALTCGPTCFHAAPLPLGSPFALSAFAIFSNVAFASSGRAGGSSSAG